MKIFYTVLLIFLVVLFSTCEEDPFLVDVDCDECYSPEPDSADLVVVVTLTDEIKEVPLVIYQGKADANIIEYVDTARSNPYYLYVKIDKMYSVEAKYELSDKVIVAVDGTKIKSRKVTDTCSETCYVIRKEKVHVELKDY